MELGNTFGYSGGDSDNTKHKPSRLKVSFGKKMKETLLR